MIVLVVLFCCVAAVTKAFFLGNSKIFLTSTSSSCRSTSRSGTHTLDKRSMHLQATSSGDNSTKPVLNEAENSLQMEFQQSQRNIARIPTRPEDLAEINDNNTNKPRGLSYESAQLSSTNNKFFKVVEKLAPNDLLLKFSKTAPPAVQEGVKSTIANILGSLPQYALDAALATTSSKLAGLMFQMQMTGYMFKNAEYKISFSNSKKLKGLPKQIPPAKRPEDAEVNALTDALSKEIEELRTELMVVREQREAELRSNILTYVQALPEQDMKKLTSDMSQDALDAIQLLVDALMERLGVDMTGPEVLIQQQVGALAQLCMWQIVVGYKLREMEAFEKGVSMD